ncbi:hypothetical protein BH09CHL1_BH09CHL1_26770 [soil metagenome]
MKIEMFTTQISIPDDDPSDIEIVVKRENDLIVVGFFGYSAVEDSKRYGWQIYLTPEKADMLMRGLQDLGGAKRAMRPIENRLYGDERDDRP